MGNDSVNKSFRLAFIVDSPNFNAILTIETQTTQRTNVRNHKHSKNSVDYKEKVK